MTKSIIKFLIQIALAVLSFYLFPFCIVSLVIYGFLLLSNIILVVATKKKLIDLSLPKIDLILLGNIIVNIILVILLMLKIKYIIIAIIAVNIINFIYEIVNIKKIVKSNNNVSMNTNKKQNLNKLISSRVNSRNQRTNKKRYR